MRWAVKPDGGLGVKLVKAINLEICRDRFADSNGDRFASSDRCRDRTPPRHSCTVAAETPPAVHHNTLADSNIYGELERHQKSKRLQTPAETQKELENVYARYLATWYSISQRSGRLAVWFQELQSEYGQTFQPMDRYREAVCNGALFASITSDIEFWGELRNRAASAQLPVVAFRGLCCTPLEHHIARKCPQSMLRHGMSFAQS